MTTTQSLPPLGRVRHDSLQPGPDNPGLAATDGASVRIAESVRLVDAKPAGTSLVYIGNAVAASVYYLDEVASRALHRCQDTEPDRVRNRLSTDTEVTARAELLATGILVGPNSSSVPPAPVSGSHVKLLTDDAPVVVHQETDFGVPDAVGYKIERS